MYLLFYPGDEDVDDVVLNLCQHLLVFVELVMLGRYHDGVNTLGGTFVAVLHRYLALGIGTEIGHLLAFLADIG